MRRQEELSVLTTQSDGTLIRTSPVFTSLCLSIHFRELAVEEELVQQGRLNLLKHLLNTTVKNQSPSFTA